MSGRVARRENDLLAKSCLLLGRRPQGWMTTVPKLGWAGPRITSNEDPSRG